MLRCALLLAVLTAAASGQIPLRALILDGQNNHKWDATTPVLKRLLEQSGLFTVEVATAPPRGGDWSGFRPDFSAYRVVVSNYNGEPWPAATQETFEKYVQGGGGFVVFHAANNAFPDWKAYNEMIGLGGWGNRTQQHGPYLRYRDGKAVRDDKPGPGGHHGKRHAFEVTIRHLKHPITAGLPEKWMHATDELYDSLRGPANVTPTALATAFADPATGGNGGHEPMLMVLSYGKGRIFHTTLGHDLEAMSCVGFITTFQRGTEWAATGRVTQKVPADFPGARVSTRP